jgi:hypothetical protein
MAVGDSALLGGLSYVAFGRETSAGTYNTCTAMLPCLSFSMVATKDNKILEQIEKSRTYSQRTGMMKKVAGDASFYFQPQLDACAFLLQNAFIGTITSATATGETVGAGANSAMDHTFNIGDTYQSFSSLCINARKGDATGGKVFEYSGVRVNEIGFSAEVNDALKVNVNLIGMDVTITSNSVSSALSQTNTSVLSFVDGRMSVENSFGSLTSSSFWHIQSVEFGWSNNLKSDNASGRIGSDILTVLPPGMATFNLRAKLRFDTTTAWSAMMAGTKLAVQLDFQGPTMSSSSIRQKLRVNFPCVYIHNAGEPTIGGPNEILTSDVEFHVLRQNDTTAGYACQAILTNQKSTYA